jgi:hypothetical protein
MISFNTLKSDEPNQLSVVTRPRAGRPVLESQRGQGRVSSPTHPQRLSDLASLLYEGVSKSFRTESIMKYTTTFVEEQRKGLWQQNSLEWLTK